jgi:hypothetical protein
MAGGTETAMGRYSLVARFSARCGRDPGEYARRAAGSLLAGLVTAPGQLPISARSGHRVFTGHRKGRRNILAKTTNYAAARRRL